MTIAVMALTASAQIYVGGEVSFWRKWVNGANRTDLWITPEVGYNLDENWAIGTRIGYMYIYDQGNKVNGFGVAPYARWTYLKLDKVNLFLDGGFGFNTYKIKYEDGTKGKAQNAWEFGIKPGVSVNLTPKLSFISHFGFFGYRDADEQTYFGDNGFGLDLNPKNITFGLYWNF